MRKTRCVGWVSVVMLVLAADCSRAAAEKSKRPSLPAALAKLKIPPAWMGATRIRYDTTKPWKEARLEIRRLLGLGDADSLRQAMKLTYLYHQKKDIGNGHEYPMYLFLGGEVAWAVRAYESFVQKLEAEKKEGHTHTYLYLAACYMHFGEYDKAMKIATLGLSRLPKPPWNVPNEAHTYDVLADIHAAKGEKDKAREYYRKAMALYPRSRQPYGRHLIPRRVAKIQSKMDLLDMAAIKPGQLRDGRFAGTSLGYVGPLTVTVTVRGGRIASVHVQHKENIPLGSTVIIPKRIVAQQSLNVDAVTGATTTCDSIRDAALQALRKAGLK